MRLQQSLFAPALSGVFIGLLGTIATACGMNASTPSDSQTQRPLRSTETSTQIYDYFKDCIISSQLQEPAPAMADSKNICLQESLAICSAETAATEMIRKCEKEFQQKAERILRSGRQVECDSGACTIIF